jgi:CPA1 family monovalent cation:H+ antiporter
MIEFLLTGLSFVLVGLQLRSAEADLWARPSSVLLTTVAVCMTVIVIRPVWIFLTARLSHRAMVALGAQSSSERPTNAVLLIMGWSGMRGVISLAVALSIPRVTMAGLPFPGRDLIVFVTFSVILVTLIGQGLTLPAVIRRLDVAGDAERLEDQEILARLRMARAALGVLDTRAQETVVPSETVDQVRALYASRIERLEMRRTLRGSSQADQAVHGVARSAARQLLRRLIDAEAAELQRLQNESAVDNVVGQRIQRSLDLQRMRELIGDEAGRGVPSSTGGPGA